MRSKEILGEDNEQLEVVQREHYVHHLLHPIIFTLLRKPYLVAPPPFLTPSYPNEYTILTGVKFTHDQYFNRKLIHQVMCSDHPHITPLYSITCAQVCDAMLQIPTGELAVRYNDSRIQWLSICTDTILNPALFKYVYNASYFSSLAAVNNPMLKLMSKGIVQRCNTRTFSVIIKKRLVNRWLVKGKSGSPLAKFVKAHYDGFVFRSCKQLVLCMLLGNYIHVKPSSRPKSLAVRQRLYEIFGNSAMTKYDRWILRLFHHCPLLLVTALRSYMIFTILHDPALKNTIDTLLTFPIFQILNEQAATVLRGYFQSYLCDPYSYLYQSLEKLPPKPCQLQHLWSCGCRRYHEMPCPKKFDGCVRGNHLQLRELEEFDTQHELSHKWSWKIQHEHELIEALLEPIQTQMKKLTSYQRPHASSTAIPTELLLPLRKRGPLVSPFTAEAETETAVSVSMSDDEDEDEDDSDPNLMLPTLGDDDDQKNKDGDDEEEDLIERSAYVHPEICRPYISPEQFQALYDIVQAIGPVGYSQPMFRVLDFFHCFGIPIQVVDYIRLLITHYQSGTMRIERIKYICHRIRKKQPAAYNILQVASDLIQQSNRQPRCLDLPLHITEAQLYTIQRCQDLDPRTTGHILQSSLGLCFCRVCMQIYSNISDPNTVYINTCRYGLRNASYSFLGDTLHCNRKYPMINYRGNCHSPTQTLTHMLAIGKLIWFKSKQIMICPQEGCGMLMSFDIRHEQYTLYNRNGPACMSCTRKLGPGLAQMSQLLLMYSSPEEQFNANLPYIRCELCPATSANIIQDPHSAYMYPYGMYLCRSHGNRFPHINIQIRAYVKSVLYTTIHTTPQERIDHIKYIFAQNVNREEEASRTATTTIESIIRRIGNGGKTILGKRNTRKKEKVVKEKKIESKSTQKRVSEYMAELYQIIKKHGASSAGSGQ